MIDVHARLCAPELPSLASTLDFVGIDLDDVLSAARSVAESAEDLASVAALAELLVDRIGQLDLPDPQPFEHDAAHDERRGIGVLPLLALLVTAPEVAAYHARRGISSAISDRSLSDLAQQVRVHRQTYGEFGLHTYPWLQIAWSGALYWLGRLQFNLQRADGDWDLSTHIPATGPLTPDSVDDSFRWARSFFAEHFPDVPTTDFWCSSWLLDPYLAHMLPAESNLARFSQRWRRYGEPMPGDDDVLFFTFSRRGEVDTSTLPRDTSLQRAIVDRLQSGGHWESWQGRIPQAEAVPGEGAVR